ncbi:uncharacterized protein Dwil_GK14586 [Drosophila willistoni]|uniref:MYND-type domain-containing protein n=1 Tax=Drosophila willistoni TaxID=7260 RepID=B4MX72_DROWI|nr:uncharacterized protein Dwil_GK14586 [Drosophila willistoni]
MANVEIYDSSDSNLSSDEYSPEEDDLMDAAVSNKPRLENTPKRTSSTGSTKNLTLEPKQLQKDEDEKKPPIKAKVETGPGLGPGSQPLKPPSNPLQTQLQIKQLKRSNRSSFYFKRRSLLWLRRLRRFPDGYMRSLKYTVTRYQVLLYRSNLRRHSMAEHSGDRHASSHSRSRSRSPASRSVSQSPELICLDDTENEESPEKLEAVKRSAPTPVKFELGTPHAPPSRKIQLNEDDKAPDPVQVVAKENGSILDEFLTLKANIATPPGLSSAPDLVPHQQTPHNLHAMPNPYDLTVGIQVTQQLAQTEADNNCLANKDDAVEVPVLETSCKRRRSFTPPSLGEKRVKSMQVDSDDDTIEFAKSEPTEQSQPKSSLDQLTQQDQQQPQHVQQQQLENPGSMPKMTTDEPIFKLGPAFTLAPQEQQPAVEQQSVVDLACMSYSLSTPTPPLPSGQVEPMEISYPTIVKQKVVVNKVVEPQSTVSDSLETPPPINAINPLASFPTFAAPQPPQKPRRSDTVYTQTINQITNQTAPQTQMPGPSQTQSQSIISSLSPSSSSLPQVAATSLPPQAGNRPRQQKSYPDLTNNDANFHYRIKELYSELDTIINDKLNSLTPELQSFMDERKRIDADIKTLDKLIVQKEEETNRLIHLRCVKEELRSRLERKERVLIIKDILPMLVNKNCSTPELYEMHSMLLEEQNAPITPKHGGPSALERCINQLESSQNDLRLLRGALNLKEPLSGIAQFGEAYRRRNSLPAGRREMQDSNFTEDHIEEMPSLSLSKRSKQIIQAQQQKRYQHLMVGNSTPNLVDADNRASSFPTQQQNHQRDQRNSFDNHFDRETAGTLKPLYNSSPMLYSRDGGHSNSKRGGGALQHSTYLSDEIKRDQERDHERDAGRSSEKKHKDSRPSMNGVGGANNDADRRCQHCERYEANFMCASCQNQWYCSRDCQLRAWDSHWEHCGK